MHEAVRIGIACSAAIAMPMNVPSLRAWQAPGSLRDPDAARLLISTITSSGIDQLRRRGGAARTTTVWVAGALVATRASPSFTRAPDR